MDSTKNLRVVTTRPGGEISCGPLIAAEVATLVTKHLNTRFGDGTHLAVTADDAEKIVKGELPAPAPLTEDGYAIREHMNPVPIVSTGLKLNFSSIENVIAAIDAARQGSGPAGSLYDGMVSSGIAGFPTLGVGPMSLTYGVETETIIKQFRELCLAEDPEAAAKELGIFPPKLGEIAKMFRDRGLITPAPDGRPPIPESAKAALREALNLKFVESAPAPEAGPAHILPAKIPAPKSQPSSEEGEPSAGKPRSGGGYGVGRLGEEKKKASDVKPK